jgi:pimeloyl-ACP methyl ester carboxylesterase
MPTDVLVHGAWAGAHGFHLVRPLLREAGHDVYTPSLTGIGERVHLSSPQVNLTTHVTDVVNTILYEDLDDITLLGFSYGGMVVTGALAHVADRVRHLVYLDAFVPDDGDSALRLTAGIDLIPVTLGAEWLVAPAERTYDDPDESAFQSPRRVAHPMGCFTEAVRLAKPLEDHPFTRTFIKATADARGEPGNDVFWAAADRAKRSDAWSYHEIDSNHMIPNNQPGALADLLLALDRAD